MMQFANLTKKRQLIIAGIVMSVLLLEFLVLEGTVGISFPSDRYSALSTAEIRGEGTERHFVTRNYRFSVVNDDNHGEPMVLRELFFRDHPI
jgi:hypothetical protein